MFLTLSHLTLFHLKFLKQILVSPASAPQVIIKISGIFSPFNACKRYSGPPVYILLKDQHPKCSTLMALSYLPDTVSYLRSSCCFKVSVHTDSLKTIVERKSKSAMSKRQNSRSQPRNMACFHNLLNSNSSGWIQSLEEKKQVNKLFYLSAMKHN